MFLWFRKTWTNQFSENFENVDIITLNKPSEITEYQMLKSMEFLKMIKLQNLTNINKLKILSKN